MEAVMLLMTYLQKYLPSKTKDVNLKAFNMITRTSEDTKIVTMVMFHVVESANSIVQHVILIKNGIMIHVNMSVKIIVRTQNL